MFDRVNYSGWIISVRDFKKDIKGLNLISPIVYHEHALSKWMTEGINRWQPNDRRLFCLICHEEAPKEVTGLLSILGFWETYWNLL